MTQIELQIVLIMFINWSEELANILTFFGMGIFEEKLNNYLSVRVKLIDEYAKKKHD